MKKIRVLVIDDSASVRQTLVAILSADRDIEVIGVASDPFVAARRIQEEVPDVITLDDKDVEFVTKLGGVDVKKKFKLADMVFGDQLAL